MPEFCTCCFWLCFHKWNLLLVAFQSQQDQSVSLANRGCCWFRKHSTLVFEYNFNPSSSVERNLSVTDVLLCSHVCIYMSISIDIIIIFASVNKILNSIGCMPLKLVMVYCVMQKSLLAYTGKCLGSLKYRFAAITSFFSHFIRT